MAKKILITCAITLVYCLTWMGLELALYGEVQGRIIDDIMMILFIPLIWKVVSINDDCGRDYVERTGKCPICLDCPHNCPLDKEQNDLVDG